MSLVGEEGRVILINKEVSWTSFDVVKKIRNLLKVKKVGHAGTLDPLATGLLIICAGKMTKQINNYMGLQKEYTGSMIIGKTTPSIDLETEFDSTCEIDHITEKDIIETSGKYIGMLSQVPPIYSAIKKGGTRLYSHARRGETVEIEPRMVEAKEFEITRINLPRIDYRLVCSKGFYVRSLVRDFGKDLGVGAYMSELSRTRIGEFELKNALTIDEFSESLKVSNS